VTPLTISGRVSHDIHGQSETLADVSVIVTTIADRRRIGATTSLEDGTYSTTVNLDLTNGEVACIVWFQKPGHQNANWVIRTPNATFRVDMEMVALFF
jgi:hypothetical protein